MGKVLIIMGSDSDLPIMLEASKPLTDLNINYEMHVSSAHRMPEETASLAKEAEERGFSVIIAGAGMAAHLPGVIAAYTILPVIGVPIKGGALNGIDALYSIVQMPKGIPVATVAINGAFNAGILAAQMISIEDKSIAQNLKKWRKLMKEELAEKDKKLNNLGPVQYISEQLK